MMMKKILKKPPQVVVVVVGSGNFGGDPRPKTVRERKNAVKSPQPGLIIQKVDTFAVSLQKKAPKTEPVAPSYPPGTLGNLLVKTSRVRQFWGGPPTKNGPGAKKCGQNTPTGSYYSKSRHFCGVIAKKSAKNRAGGAKLPPRYFGKPACCTMVPKHPDTLKTPTLPYVLTPLPPKFWLNMCMHVMGGCQAGKAQRKCEHGPGNRPGPLLFLKFSIILGQINKRFFWSVTCFRRCQVGQSVSRRR